MSVMKSYPGSSRQKVKINGKNKISEIILFLCFKSIDFALFLLFDFSLFKGGISPRDTNLS